MSDPNVPVQPPSGNPYFTQRLWSEEVGLAMAEAEQNPLSPDPGYLFGNGRKFDAGSGSAGG